jgi:hypothetical protein
MTITVMCSGRVCVCAVVCARPRLPCECVLSVCCNNCTCESPVSVHVVRRVLCFIIFILQFPRCQRSPRARARSPSLRPATTRPPLSHWPRERSKDPRLEATAQASVHEYAEAFMLGFTLQDSMRASYMPRMGPSPVLTERGSPLGQNTSLPPPFGSGRFLGSQCSRC